jgi:hypothetical protein
MVPERRERRVYSMRRERHAALTLMLLAPRFEARERGVFADLPTLPILWSDSDIVLSVVDALEIQAR